MLHTKQRVQRQIFHEMLKGSTISHQDDVNGLSKIMPLNSIFDGLQVYMNKPSTLEQLNNNIRQILTGKALKHRKLPRTNQVMQNISHN